LYFSTFAMFGFAILVLAAAFGASRGATPARPLLAIVAAVYIAFGLGAFILWRGSAHTLGYLLIGVIIGVAIAPRGSPDGSARNAVLP